MSETYFCPKCGAQMNLLTGGAYCPNCGHVVLKWELDLPPAGLSPYETMLGVQTMAENIVEDSKEWKHRAERAEAENTELKARLEKAVELPYKIGDTIYHVTNLELQELKVISFEITENHGIMCYTRAKNGDIYILAGGLFDTWVFIDKAEAEVKLSELRSEK